MPEPLTKEERGEAREYAEYDRANPDIPTDVLERTVTILHYEATVAALEKELAALVRCADCRFWIRVQGNEGDCTAHRVAIVSKGDCYCSWGVKKDG